MPPSTTEKPTPCCHCPAQNSTYKKHNQVEDHTTTGDGHYKQYITNISIPYNSEEWSLCCFYQTAINNMHVSPKVADDRELRAKKIYMEGQKTKEPW